MNKLHLISYNCHTENCKMQKFLYPLVFTYAQGIITTHYTILFNENEICINHQLNAQFLYPLIVYITLYSTTCFEHRCAHLQETRTRRNIDKPKTLIRLTCVSATVPLPGMASNCSLV